MKSITVSLFILTLFVVVNASGQEKFLMEYKYVKGTSYRYQEESKYESVQEVNGQEMKANGSTFSLMNMKVEDVAETGNITFIGFLEDYRVVAKMAMMDTTMVMKDFLNRNIQTVISKRGELIDTKVLDTTSAGNDFMGMGNSQYNVFKEFISFPGKEISPGETWTDQRTDTTKGTQMVTKTDLVYTLRGIEEKNGHSCFKAGFTGKTEIGGKMTQMGMDFFMEGTGELSGTVWFDRNNCVLVYKESTNDQEMTMALTGQMQMIIPITSTTTSRVTLME